MTLEEIKADFKEMWNMARNEDGNPFYLGAREAYEYAIAIIDKLEPSWHPYPAEKPTEDGAYLITRYTKHGGIFIDIDSWISEYEMFDSTEDIPSSMKVLAWMELPKPYKREETEC